MSARTGPVQARSSPSLPHLEGFRNELKVLDRESKTNDHMREDASLPKARPKAAWKDFLALLRKGGLSGRRCGKPQSPMCAHMKVAKFSVTRKGKLSEEIRPTVHHIHAPFWATKRDRLPLMQYGRFSRALQSTRG